MEGINQRRTECLARAKDVYGRFEHCSQACHGELTYGRRSRCGFEHRRRRTLQKCIRRNTWYCGYRGRKYFNGSIFVARVQGCHEYFSMLAKQRVENWRRSFPRRRALRSRQNRKHNPEDTLQSVKTYLLDLATIVVGIAVTLCGIFKR